MEIHPYVLVFFGILLWQAEQAFTVGLRIKERMNFVGRSLIWGGAIVVFDDEILDYLYDTMGLGFETEWYFYIIAGFFIDIIRTQITKRLSEKTA